MFKRKQRKAILSMIRDYQPTSKSNLKQFCLMTARGDVKQARELYDFMIKDMEDLPALDPVPPTWVDNTKQAVGGFFDFIKENKDGLGQVYDIIRGIAAARGKSLPSIGGETAAEALPSIN